MDRILNPVAPVLHDPVRQISDTMAYPAAAELPETSAGWGL